MTITVQLFAVAKDLAGRSQVSVELAEGATIADLRRTLAAQVPALASLVPHLMFAIGTDYADNATTIPAHADIACIPPVSGG